MTRSGALPAKMILIACGAWLGLAGVSSGRAGPFLQSLSPRDWNRSLVARGHASESLGQRADALADYTLAIESHTLSDAEQARVLFDRGLLLDGMGRLDDALSDYNAALSLSPDFAAALNNRANIYRRTSHLAEARHDYLASLAAGNSQSQYPYYGLGQIAEVQGDKSAAREFYSRALAADPNYGLALVSLAGLEGGKAVIHLHLPAAKPVPTAGAGGAEAIDPMVLRPPVFPDTSGKPSQARPAATASASSDSPSPSLKPSLDQYQSGPQVQLGAWRSRAEAESGWDHIRAQAGEALSGHSHRILAVDLPKRGHYYRLRVDAGQTGSKALCASLSRIGLDCIPIRN